MSIPLVTVVATLVDPSGNPLDGATITAQLSGPMVYEDVITTVKEVGLTDFNGQTTLRLIPNNLNHSSNTYSFTIEHPLLVPPLVYYDIVVPASPIQTTLQALLGWVPSGPISQIYWTGPDPWTAENYWY